jgi:hypothetical protein
LNGSWQLVVLQDPLGTATPLRQELQTLIARIEALTRGDPAASALLRQLQQGSNTTPTDRSLVARFVLLNRLVASLSTDPLLAPRLAPVLPSLRHLVTALLRAEKKGALGGWMLWTGWQLSGRGNPDPVLSGLGTLLVPPWASASPAGVGSWAPGQGLERSSKRGSASASQVRERPEMPRPVPQSVALPAPPPSTPLPEGGAAVGASGGIGSAAPAIALLAMLSVWLLTFSQRVVLDLVPWRSTLLSSRLERPG